ncbi:BlaI/MecI/CopY family transcriptional regulator [soil metagenome]
MSARARRPLAEVLGPLEAEVMDVIWDRGEVTVRDVYDDLRARRAIAYTTVMTTMGRLADKGFLGRVENRQAHRYWPLLSKERYARSTVQSVMDWLVGQFQEPTVAYLVDRVDQGDRELLESLRTAIDRAREKKQRDD